MSINVVELRENLEELKRLLKYSRNQTYKLKHNCLYNAFGNVFFFREYLRKEMENVSKAIMMVEGNKLIEKLKENK